MIFLPYFFKVTFLRFIAEIAYICVHTCKHVLMMLHISLTYYVFFFANGDVNIKLPMNKCVAKISPY